MNIGNAIRLCRTQQGLTQEELAEKANLSTSYISLLEQNKRDPAFSTIENIAMRLGIPTSIFLFLASDPAELSSVDKELAEKLSFTALQFIREKASEPTLF
jgi:transcriptional regulator with XRE-family HTH domain